MASTSGTKRGVCGHVMASFDPHDWCERCREKVVGSDPWVRGEEPCKFCVVLTPEQIFYWPFQNIKLERERRQKVVY